MQESVGSFVVDGSDSFPEHICHLQLRHLTAIGKIGTRWDPCIPIPHRSVIRVDQAEAHSIATTLCVQRLHVDSIKCQIKASGHDAVTSPSSAAVRAKISIR